MQFVSRGILSEQTFFGVNPRGWECCIANSTEAFNNTVAPSVSSLKVSSEANISATDSFSCYKLRNVTMSVDSELKTAFSISFAIYLFAVTALGIGFKLLAGLCTSRKESHPTRNPILFYTLVLSLITIVYEIGLFVLMAVWPGLLLIGDNGEVAYVLTTGVFTLLWLSILVGCLEFGLEENDIPWRYIRLPESVTEPFRSAQNNRQRYNEGLSSNRQLHTNVGVPLPDSDQSEED